MGACTLKMGRFPHCLCFPGFFPTSRASLLAGAASSLSCTTAGLLRAAAPVLPRVPGLRGHPRAAGMWQSRSVTAARAVTPGDVHPR